MKELKTLSALLLSLIAVSAANEIAVSINELRMNSRQTITSLDGQSLSSGEFTKKNICDGGIKIP
jgi:hypothetical protein